MSVDLWVEGVIIEFGDSNPCRRAIVRAVGKNEIVLADIKNGSVHKISQKQLDAMYASSGCKLLAESRDFGGLAFADLTEKEQRETNRKYRYIKKLQENGISKITEKSSAKIIKEVALEIGENAPHWQTIRGWYGSFLESGRKMRGLYPRHRFKGSNEPKIDIRILKIIKKEAKRHFKTSQPSMATAHRNVEEKILAHNLDYPNDPLRTPNYLTVQSRILEGQYHNKRKARQGSQSLDEELAGTKSGIKTSRILERVEMDHTLLDIHLLHDDHNTLLGRPYITVIIDHYSHMVLGFQLSFENPSFASVCVACINAFLPKDIYLDVLGCAGSWPAHGIPTTVVTDNANEFWGKNFGAVADEIGSDFLYAPIRKGRYKSRVERFFGIVNSLVLDDLPGVVRKPGDSGDGYDAAQEARMTFTELKRYLVNWITTVFHNSPIEESSSTPNELWSSSEEDFPIAVEDERELLPILLATTTRELSGSGVRIFGMDYCSDIVKDLYRRDGPRTVTVKYNPFDIGYILILDDKNKEYILAESDEFEYASGLSLFQHKKIRAQARADRKSKLDNPDLQKARVKLMKEREEVHARNSRRKTQVTTSKAARADKIGVDEIKLVVDNTKRAMVVDDGSEEDDLNLDGWSMD